MKKLLFLVSLVVFSFLCVPVEAASIIVDGDPSDWAGIPPIPDPDDWPYDQIDIKEVYVTSDGNNIYFRIDVYDVIITGAYYRFFIDADQDPGTGMSFAGVMGADYQLGLYNGYGYGMSMDYTTSFTVQAAYSGSTLELGVNSADLGNPSAFDFIVFCNPSDGGYPQYSYIIANDQTITIDGNPGDWTGDAFFTDDQGDALAASLDLWGCYVGSNGTHLLTMMNTTGVIDPAIWGMVYVSHDTTMNYFQAPLGVGWTVWEGGKALSDLGLSVSDEIYVMFELVSHEGDFAPDQGYSTYSIIVGGEILPVDALRLISPYLLILVLIVGTVGIFYKKRIP